MRLLAVAAAVLLRSRSPDTTELFTYGKHGQDWVGASCASRARQSPIDLPAKVLTQMAGETLPLRYQSEKDFTLVNNGHCIHVDVENQGLGGLTFENAWYNLLSINLHAAGEHTLAGHRPALELHLVHKRYDSDALVVLALPFDSLPPAPAAPAAGGNGTAAANATDAANASNASAPKGYVRPDPSQPGYTPWLEVFTERAPPDKFTQVPVVRPWDLNGLVAGNFVAYDGSLTAPPCSENVRWYVRQQPLNASTEQVKVLTDATLLMNPQGNWRVPFPLNDRPLKVARTVNGEPRLNATKKVEGPRNPTTLSERAALGWGQDAVSQAMQHLFHIKNIDQRLRAGADAHALGLQPTMPSANVPFTPGAHGDDPLYYAGSVSKGLATSLRKAMDETVSELGARIYPLPDAVATKQGIQDTLRAGIDAGNAQLASNGVA
jgi:carbonic anhydrase